ncbi:MAG TPA: beta-ketoacyl-[acyl-carrier-protein] synthase family protein [Acidobacteriota bacterium]
MTGGPRRVVATGLGWTTPFGTALKDTWAALLEGRSAISAITTFEAGGFPVRIAGEIKFGAELRRRFNAFDGQAHTLYALAAAAGALQDSGLDPTELRPERLGVYLGASKGCSYLPELARATAASSDGDRFDPARFLACGADHVDPRRREADEYHHPALAVARWAGAGGPIGVTITSCAAGSQAIGEAYQIVRRGEADVMLTGGTEAMVDPLSLAGFAALGSLSRRNEEPAGASRPFDRERDGFVLAEGAGVIVLEELEHARRRGAPIYGELAGYASTFDAFRVTDPEPDGRGARAAMQRCLEHARVAPDQVDAINAHGTSTLLNDAIETRAIKQIFGPRAARLPVSATKSMLGHMIAAAGAVECIACFLSLRDQVLHPTINLDHPDPECDLDYVPRQSRPHRARVLLSNAFGFGGQNVCLLVRAL